MKEQVVIVDCIMYSICKMLANSKTSYRNQSFVLLIWNFIIFKLLLVFLATKL